MFTGIIEETGRIKSIRRGTRSITLEVQAQKVMQDTMVGDSIATNGVCLTVTTVSPSGFTADVMPETMHRTAFAQLVPGSMVNLERALTLQTRLGGHMVSGHIDGTGTLVRRTHDDNAIWLWVETSPGVMRYIIEKGSVALQGVSLTVAKVNGMQFAVSLIPHTQSATTLHAAKTGDVLNIENDMVAKYVEKLLADTPQPTQDSIHNSTAQEAEKLARYRQFMLSK